jgi:very-short-patch-repair endonuclease
MDQAKYKEFLKIKYFDEGLSFNEIAKLLDSYSNKVRRDFIKFGFKPRSKAEAQANVLFWEKARHPTKGKKRSEEDKISISNTMAEMWRDMDEKSKEKRSNKAKKNWNKMSVKEQREFREKASTAMRQAATTGSKMEKLLSEFLLELGYNNTMHDELMLLNGNLQIDIYVPSLKLVIEVDGPTHYLPIWGEEKLAKTVNSDNEKNGLLLSDGYSVVRFKHIVKKITEKYKRDVKAKFEQMMPEFKKNIGTPKLYLLEI